MLVVTELFNITVYYFDAKKPAHYRRVLVVTELVVSGTQCISPENHKVIEVESERRLIKFDRNLIENASL